MANPEHIDILRQGPEVWNNWRSAHPQVSPDFSGADLAGIILDSSFSRANLREADFTGCNLRDARLSGSAFGEASFVGADLRKSHLRGAVLSLANLSGADLRDSDLIAANLREATLTGANFDGAAIGWTVFGDNDLRAVKALDRVIHLAPSTLGVDTLYRSAGCIPEIFLRSAGIPDRFISGLGMLITPTDAIQYYSCFISYSHADKPFALQLHDSLQNRGIRCWLDEKQLIPGDDIYEHVDRGIRLWDKFLLCCSKHSLQPASWVDKEIAAALDKEDELTRKRGVKVRALIPLNLDDYLLSEGWESGYRAEIRRRLAADFTGWQADRGRFEAQVEKVIRALRADEGSRENPPESRL